MLGKLISFVENENKEIKTKRMYMKSRKEEIMTGEACRIMIVTFKSRCYPFWRKIKILNKKITNHYNRRYGPFCHSISQRIDRSTKISKRYIFNVPSDKVNIFNQIRNLFRSNNPARDEEKEMHSSIRS